MRSNELEEKILQHKSKVDWITLGDNNNSYFHANIKTKNKQTLIRELEDENGHKLTDHQDLEKETKQISTTSSTLKHIDITDLRGGTQLQIEHQSFLVQLVTDDEIWKAVKILGNNKAPGIDGFNGYFFEASWNVVKRDVTSAVQDFFMHNRLYKHVNCVLFTLIPKSMELRA